MTAAGRIALFSASVSFLFLIGLVAARANLPTDKAAVALSFCLGLWPLLGPAAVTRLRGSIAGLGEGALTVIFLIAPFALLLLGLVGQVIVCAGAGLFILACVVSIGVPSWWRALAWTSLLVVAAMLLLIQIGGTKYVNLFADQLALFGRTDGDVFGHGAITNSLRFFGEPSMGIDGIERLRYHFGVNLFAAAVAREFDLDATFALILVKVLVLVPLLIRTAASAGLSVMRLICDVHARPDALEVAFWTVALVAFLPLSDIGNIRIASESMLLGGILLLCGVPSLVRYWVDSRNVRPADWIFWLVMIPLVSVSKISAGAIWFGLIGYSALRKLGMRRAVFWFVSCVAALLFAGVFWLCSDPNEMGAQWFGEPFFVERGWKEGNYLLPVTALIEWFLALIALWIVGRRAPGSAGRPLLELLLIAGIGANLPGLLMYIPGGDAYYFIAVADWIALPILIASCMILRRLWDGKVAHRMVLVGGLGAFVALMFPSVAAVKLNLRHFIAGDALLRTGDLSYYDNDNKRPVREDAERAWDSLDRGLLLGGPVATAPAESLVAQLEALRAEHGTKVALYAPVEAADFWGYLRDCDLSSNFPIAVTGVQMIDGYYPDQSICRQEIGRRGYHDVPLQRTSRDDASLCDLARQHSIDVVYVITSLSNRHEDRLLKCAS